MRHGTERLRRIHKVFQWLTEGLTDQEVYEKCTTEFQIGKRQANNYLRKARKFLTQRFEQERMTELAYIVARLKRGEHLALKDNDLTNYRGALMDQAKLLGLLTNNINLTVQEQDEYPDIDAAVIEESITTH